MSNTVKRFIVVYDELEKYKDPEDLVWEDPWGNGGVYLVDTKTNEIVFGDCMEPEDASLDRSLSPLVDLLNKVATE